MAWWFYRFLGRKTTWMLLLYILLIAYAVYSGRLFYVLYASLAFFAVLSQRTQLLLIENGVDVNFVQGYAMAFVRWPLSLFALIAFIAGTVWALHGMEWYEALLIFFSCCGVGTFLVKKDNLVSRAWKKPFYDVAATIFALLMWFVVGT